MESLELPDYSDILESIQDGLVVVDRELKYLYINKKAEQLIHISKEKLIGKKFTDAFPDHNLNISNLLKEVNKSWMKNKVATLEIPFAPLNSWYSLIVYPLKDKYSIIFRDITEEKQLKRELQNSREELDLIFQHVSDGIVIQDPTGKIIYANGAAASISGFLSVEDMLKTPRSTFSEQYDIFDQQKKPVLWKDAPADQVLFQEKKSVETVLCFVNKKTKEEIWTDIKTAPIYSGDRRGICAISIFHDITALKQLEKQKDNFLSLVSHELKTPLTSIKVFLDLLQRQSEKVEDPTITNMITKIAKNTDKLIELIHSLLDVSRIQEGKLKLQKRFFSLRSLLHEVGENIQPMTAHPILIKAEEDRMIYADRERIAQVLINLLTNAIKYSKDTHQIIINNVQTENESIVSIRDYGFGISQKDQKEIFKKFYQSGENSTFPGLGLGLYISSEIIKEHGGKIWVESKKGVGSMFSFSLPVEREGS